MGRNCEFADGSGSVSVALHVRAWVEICSIIIIPQDYRVALHVRAWVEIELDDNPALTEEVALHVRAWVEIG